MSKPVRGIDLLKAKTTAALLKCVIADRGGEEKLHIDVVDYVTRNKTDGLEFWHTPNGGKRNIKAAVKLKAMGTRRGVPDLIFALPDKVMVFLELKSPAHKNPFSKLTDEQKTFLFGMKRAGHITACLSDYDLIIRFLKIHGVVRANANSRLRVSV
jgi:hypothetical protein